MDLKSSFFTAVGCGDLEYLKIIIKNEGLDLSFLLSLQSDGRGNCFVYYSRWMSGPRLAGVLGVPHVHLGIVRSWAIFPA